MAVSDHTRALVPLEAWCYSAPELLSGGRRIDVGILAEALIYYDRILVNLPAQVHFADFLRWFEQRGARDTLLGLVRDGVIEFYDYGFISTALSKDTETSRIMPPGTETGIRSSERMSPGAPTEGSTRPIRMSTVRPIRIRQPA